MATKRAAPRRSADPALARSATTAASAATQRAASEAPKLDRLTLSIQQAALTLSIGPSRMYELVIAGAIPGCFQLTAPGGRWFVPVAGLRAWVAEQSHGTTVADEVVVEK